MHRAPWVVSRWQERKSSQHHVRRLAQNRWTKDLSVKLRFYASISKLGLASNNHSIVVVSASEYKYVTLLQIFQSVKLMPFEVWSFAPKLSHLTQGDCSSLREAHDARRKHPRRAKKTERSEQLVGEAASKTRMEIKGENEVDEPVTPMHVWPDTDDEWNTPVSQITGFEAHTDASRPLPGNGLQSEPNGPMPFYFDSTATSCYSSGLVSNSPHLCAGSQWTSTNPHFFGINEQRKSSVNYNDYTDPWQQVPSHNSCTPSAQTEEAALQAQMPTILTTATPVTVLAAKKARQLMPATNLQPVMTVTPKPSVTPAKRERRKGARASWAASIGMWDAWTKQIALWVYLFQTSAWAWF